MTTRGRLKRMVRNFPENGLKMLFEHPHNVRDLLRLRELPFLDRLDLDQMKVDPTRFVHRDYRHLESDLVLTVPLRTSSLLREVIIYILIEEWAQFDRIAGHPQTVRLDDHLASLDLLQLHSIGDGING
jgi:hypothetical protein